MSRAKLLPTVKTNGTHQRDDVALTPAIAVALRDLILSSKPLQPRGTRSIALHVAENGQESLIELSIATLHSWVSRGNVIPGSGVELRAYLDEARVEKRNREEATRQAKIREEAEKLLLELVDFKIDPVEVIERYKVTPEGEKILRSITKIKNSPQLMETTLKAAMFALERLNPGSYGARLETKSSNFTFSLAEIAKAREEMSKEGLLEKEAIQATPAQMVEASVVVEPAAPMSVNEEQFSKVPVVPVMPMQFRYQEPEEEENTSHVPTGTGVDIFNAGADAKNYREDNLSLSSM